MTTQDSARPGKIIGIISFTETGGAQEALLRVSRQMRERGHDMEVWFLYRKSAVHDDEPFTRVFSRAAKPSPLEFAAIGRRLIAALRAERPAAVIGFLPLGATVGLAASAVAGVPIRVASHRSPGTTYGKVMRVLDRLLGATPVYGRMICVSDAVRQSFADYPRAYRDKLTVVHNGIEWLPSSMTKAQARAALGLPPDAFVFAAVGRTEYQKNYQVLIEAMPGVSGGILAIIGDGSERADLEARAAELGVADRILFLGARGRQECRDLLRAADAFVQSSRFEGQSNAVLEAMHEGLPMALSDIPEQRETIQDPETGEIAGLLAPVSDVAAWSDALNRIHGDERLRRTLAERATSMVEARFTLGQMIDGFEAVLVPRSAKAA